MCNFTNTTTQKDIVVTNCSMTSFPFLQIETMIMSHAIFEYMTKKNALNGTCT